MRNIFENTNTNIAGECFVVNESSIANEIRAWNTQQDNREKNIKKIALITTIIMLILWIGGDFLGMPEAFELFTGLMALFGYWAIVFIGGTWMSRPSVRRKNEEMATRSMIEMNVPDDAKLMEVVIPQKKDSAGWIKGNPNGWFGKNEMMMMYSDATHMYLANVYQTVGIPLTSFYNLSQKPDKIRFTTWLQEKPVNQFKKQGVKVNNGRIKGYNIVVPFYTASIHGKDEDFSICVPSYELEAFCEITKLKIYV